MDKLEFKTKVSIEKGWSGDQKYCVTDNKDTKYLLRISPIEKQESKKSQFERMKQLDSIKIPMCRPIAFGICADGVYSLQSWIDGKMAEDLIPYLSDTEQYVYGIKAGQILKKIHSIPAPDGIENWENRFNRKIDKKIKMYQECPLKYENGDCLLSYIEANRCLLHDRPQSYQHGDYHIGNMMIDESGQLVIIDFDRDDYGDPWEEFNRIVWCAHKSPLFASGMVNGYFDFKVPMDFWKLLALYITTNTISSLPWAIPYGETEVTTMKNQAKQVLEWYDNMKNPVPSWYFSGYYLQYIDGIPYKMKAAYDFSFLSQYGRVFKVFDDQDSGNICFGVEKEGKRYFVKFAGAPTEQYTGDPADAVQRLKDTANVYQTLRHPNLIQLIESKEIGTGFAMVFAWEPGECMGRMYPQSRRKFMSMDLATRERVFEKIMDFLCYVAKMNYVAIDFYDASILYDFDSEKTIICDIDYFREMPCSNDMGRMFGSSLFQSPEEYQLGAVIDEVTNVYTLGAMAFALFANYSREQKDWPLNQKSYKVIKRSVSEDRDKRQQSIEQLISEWNKAIEK